MDIKAAWCSDEINTSLLNRSPIVVKGDVVCVRRARVFTSNDTIGASQRKDTHLLQTKWKSNRKKEGPDEG